MGQQQLILLVLATVIVGVAIVVGIRAFTENSAKSNADAMTQDAVRMANDAQAWKKKPAPFGGQANNLKTDTDNFTTLTSFQLLGYAPATGGALKYSNINGCYTIAPSGTGLLITGVNDVEGNEVRINVTGITDAAIAPVTGYPVVGSSTATDDCGTAPTP